MTYQQKLKQKRRLERMDEKEQQQLVDTLLKHFYIVSLYCAMEVFKERATNPKLEQFIKRLLKVFNDVNLHNVNLERLQEEIAQRKGIIYDMKTGDIYNRKKNKNGKS